MPHLHLETTADLPENAHIPDILEALVNELSIHDTIKSETLKAYHALRSNWVMGAGAPAGFAHLQVLILAGRPLELRQKIARSLYEVLRKQFQESLDANEVVVSLELREMDPATYLN